MGADPLGLVADSLAAFIDARVSAAVASALAGHACGKDGERLLSITAACERAAVGRTIRVKRPTSRSWSSVLRGESLSLLRGTYRRLAEHRSSPCWRGLRTNERSAMQRSRGPPDDGPAAARIGD